MPDMFRSLAKMAFKFTYPLQRKSWTLVHIHSIPLPEGHFPSFISYPGFPPQYKVLSKYKALEIAPGALGTCTEYKTIQHRETFHQKSVGSGFKIEIYKKILENQYHFYFFLVISGCDVKVFSFVFFYIFK